MNSEEIYRIAKYWLNQDNENSSIDFVKVMADDLKRVFDNKKIISSNPELIGMLDKSRVIIAQMKRSMLVHPDCEIGSEFDDLTSTAQEIEDEISNLINKVIR